MNTRNEQQQATDDLERRRHHSRARLQKLAWWLDDAIRIPGIGLRVGVDSIIGLVPVVGDFAGVALSSIIFAEAVRMRAPRHVLTRMGRNMLTDFLVGLVPFVGDAFDVAWRANRRNMDLLEDWLDAEDGKKSRRRWPAIGAAVVGLTLAGLLSVYLWRSLAA